MIEFEASPTSFNQPPIPCDCSSGLFCPVGIRHFCVTEPERTDLDGTPRRFMVSALYPAADTSQSPAQLVDIFFSRLEQVLELLLRNASATEAAYIRERLPRLTLQAQRDAPAAQEGQGYPVLLFNPGGESSRASCLPLSEALAAAGYVVLTLDGIGDSPAQVFPDGEILTLPPRPGESYITPRIADMRFLLDQLPALNSQGPLAERLNLDQIGALGHSRGGYLANIAAVEDDRIRAAANMDGFLWGIWENGTGLSKYPVNFQERARSLRTPILRLVGEQPSRQAAQERFVLESKDFGGLFLFAALQGFEHRHFSSAPYFCATSEATVVALQAMDQYRETVQVLAPILTNFFDASLRGTPLAAQTNVRASDFFAARHPDLLT